MTNNSISRRHALCIKRRKGQRESGEPNEMIEKRAKKKKESQSPRQFVLPSVLCIRTLPSLTLLRSPSATFRSD
ncbi:hypothetical protein RJT34_06348 [Clitoria ternatea]|uniref:Uncharacterized protein n=1 Tax=Clitoria ternatea TaxID=43366 RepID=A0AAN9K429_CLITE